MVGYMKRKSSINPALLQIWYFLFGLFLLDYVGLSPAKVHREFHRDMPAIVIVCLIMFTTSTRRFISIKNLATVIKDHSST